MSLGMQITLVFLVALYIAGGYMAWMLVGLTDPKRGEDGIDLLELPHQRPKRLAFLTVFVVFLLSWPVWFVAGKLNVWREDRSAACNRVQK
jgi:hypothetical protein